MSRAPGGFGINDIRTSALLVEYVHKTNPCAPGVEARGKCNYFYILDCGRPPYGFDRPADTVSLLAAFVIIATVIGQIHCFALYFPVVQKEYNMGFVEVSFTAALTYAVLIKTSCLGCVCIQWCGHRLTCMFGMLLIFIGTILDSQVLHYIAFHLCNILLFGVGGGLAYTAAMCIPGDILRKNLITGVISTCIAGRIGTLVYYWLSLFLLSHISYKWTKLSLAVITLVIAGACNVLPSFKVDEGCLKPRDTSKRNKNIKDFVEDTIQNDETQPPKEEVEEACLCVCVCDVSLWTDWSFLLWGVCVCLATLGLFLPYMFTLSYADSLGIELSPWYISSLCITSILSRTVFLIGNDYSYFYNRIFFQCAVLLSGFLWIFLIWAETYGWLLVWCGTMGIIEGVIVCLIPRVTLVTIPRKWLEHSWGWILWFHAIGICSATIFVAIVARQLHDFYVGYMTIGILQIICSIIAFLLPNEEMCVPSDFGSSAVSIGTIGGNGNNYGVGRTQSTAGESSVTGYPRPRSTLNGNLHSSAFNLNDFPSRYFPLSSSINSAPHRAHHATPRANCSSSGAKNYKCNCPICMKIGCIPECRDCVPGGLSQGGLSPCNPAIDSYAPGTQ